MSGNVLRRSLRSMEGEWQPDLIVGIDFGMTCTGVAWSMSPDWPPPRTIQHWPGKLGHELRNKVDTAVSYDCQTGDLASWGFLCDPHDERCEQNELFKLALDPTYHDPSEHAPTVAEARRWYLDYMRCLYGCLVRRFAGTIPRFGTKKIDYVFSVPVSWKKVPSMIAQIEHAIREAGFGSKPNERASITLTEAEAAAISATKQFMARGDVILVCDAGGGTTDLHTLKVESITTRQTTVQPLTWTEGEAVGSTVIDFRIRRIIRHRLMAVRNQISGDLDTVISAMMLDKFDTFKHSFGNVELNVPKLFLPIPGVPAGLDISHANIEDSKVVITREEMKAVFDDQVTKLCNLIDRQIQQVREMHPMETINYLCLSGGLGSSPYVQDCIKARYSRESRGLLPGAESLEVVLASEPQLAVVHGLVIARIQAIQGGPEVYTHLCSPDSFGILCRELYDSIKHQGEVIVLDPYDNKRWAEQQIFWLIKQGDVVRTDTPLKQPYQLKLAMGQELQSWKTQIVMSSLPASQLPSSLKHPGARQICVIETTLDLKDMKRKNRHWYNLGKEYNRASFEIRVRVNTGLKFEVCGKDGVRSHGEIAVQWENADTKSPNLDQNTIVELYP